MKAQSAELDGPDLDYEAELCGNIEQALKALQGYGIMALELIQNADDACAATLTIDAREDALVVENNEQFSRCSLARKSCDWADGSVEESGGRQTCNFHAITRMGGRSKLGWEDQIGRFGIGFVSVYQITDTPIIRSGGVEYTLNPKEGRASRKNIPALRGTQFVLPWAFAASPIRDAIHAAVVPAEVADLVVNEIAAILPSSVLFLRNLKRIELLRQGRMALSVDIDRTETGIDLLIGPSNQVQRWVVQSRDASDLVQSRRLFERFPGLRELHRATAVSVAIPANFEIDEGLLYAYLPTKKATGLPLHINADFFPHASRQEIVLGNESQERFWNEAVLDAAAAIIGERFELLKTTLGHRGLWKLGEASRLLAGRAPSFAAFWANFRSAAKSSESVWTWRKTWELPTEVRASPGAMGDDEQRALSSFGVPMLDPSLREYLNALQGVGVQSLRLEDIASAMSRSDPELISLGNPELMGLWAALNIMLEPSRGSLGQKRVPQLGSLAAIPFLLDRSGSPLRPDAAWRLPDNVPPALLEKVLHETPVLHEDVLRFPNLVTQVALLGLDEFAAILAGKVANEQCASELFGDDPSKLRNTYRLLTLLWREPLTTRAGGILKEVPILRNSDGSFTVPARAQLPGAFRDPTGWFHLVDTSLFPPGMDRFAENVLGVGVMSFSEFIENHLQEALEREITQTQYKALLSEIADHRHELGDVLEALGDIPFVWNRAGELALASDCYFWDAAIESILGSDPARWVDEKALPSDAARQRILRDLLESRLGMPTRAAAEHVLERVQQISEQRSPAEAKRQLTPIFRHLVDVWPRLDAAYRDTLGELADIAFLPAQFDGEPDNDTLHLPGDVYRAGRAPGFSSQVPIIDLAPLRQGTKSVNDLLELIGVPEEPDTEVVVDHLVACIKSDRPPHPLTYQILGERCEADDGLDVIDRLADLPFIYDTSRGFLPADRVFWGDPPIGRYWHKASRAMTERASLFSRLGVCVSPEPRHYADLAMLVAALSHRDSEDAAIHARCLHFLAEALRDDAEGAREAVDDIAEEESLISLVGVAIWPADGLWMDSEQHLAPFNGDLDQIVVRPPAGCDIATLRRLYSRLGTQALSANVTLNLAHDPEAAIDAGATEVMRTRAGMLLRLAPTPEARIELRKLLDGITVQVAPRLFTRAQLVRNDVVYRSDPTEAEAFIDASEPSIYLAGERVRWVVLARHLFDALGPLCPAYDMRSIAGTAASILQASTYEDAEDILQSLGFVEIPDGIAEIPIGEQLSGDGDSSWLEGSDETSDKDASGSDDRAAGLPSAGDPVDQSEENEEAEGTPLSPEGTGESVGLPPGDAPDESYKSKARGGDLGDQRGGDGSGAENARGDEERGSAGVEHPGGSGRNSGRNAAEDRAQRGERRKRRSRLLSYVTSDDYTSEHRDDDENEDDKTGPVGAAAVAAVLDFERYHQRAAEEQPHYNPGFDVESRDASGSRRLIEVKGIDGEWTELGVKLSRRQFRFAQDHPEEFWLYVVEHALDPQKRVVRPLRNPFARVDGYFFDHEWRNGCEQGASSRELLLRLGAVVEDLRWGRGSIVQIKERGITKQVVVDFGLWGKKLVPLGQLNIIE